MREREPRWGRAELGLVAVAMLMVVTAACQAWTGSRRDPAFTSFNPDESVLASTNIAQVVEQFSIPGASSAPVFLVNTGFVAVGTQLVAFDRRGITSCSGSPKTCAPLWTASLAGPLVQLVVDGSRVFVAASPSAGSSTTISAFDANGVEGCTGSPVVCSPEWTAVGASFGAITAADGVVVVTSSGGLQLFDGAGVNGCGGTPNVCAPMRRTSGSAGQPAIANHKMYAAFNDASSHIGVWSLDGGAGCSGDPLVCEPLFTDAIPSSAPGILAPPTVSDGLVVVALRSNSGAGAGAAVTFDAEGVQGCSGTPTVCQPLFFGAAFGSLATLQGSSSAAYGRIYAPVGGAIVAYDPHATGCTGSPATCAPLFAFADANIFGTNVVVANHLAYLRHGSSIGVYDADGVQGCTASAPRTCQPLATIPVDGSVGAVLEGQIFVEQSNGAHVLHVYSLPS